MRPPKKPINSNTNTTVQYKNILKKQEYNIISTIMISIDSINYITINQQQLDCSIQGGKKKYKKNNKKVYIRKNGYASTKRTNK